MVAQKMAGNRRLMLSGLKTNTSYHLSNNVSPKRCLINVKLTDFCMKSVESLMDSEKGAYFSLWFDENGGKMSIPVNQDKRIFQFKAAPLHDGEGHSSLECVHQGITSPHSQDHLSCWGVTEHRLTVQGTDEVYMRTKQQVKEAEKLRKEQRTQEIKVPQSRMKSKPGERVSPVPIPSFRRPNRPKPVIPSFTRSTVGINKISGLSIPKPHPSQPKSIGPSQSLDSKLISKAGSSRSTYSLKDRVIHILALKPHTREHIVARLKKATKRSENAMTNLDSILDEVSEISLDGYKLKIQFLKNLEVDQWPFYSNAEKQMLKRSKNIGGVNSLESVYEGSGGISEGGGEVSSLGGRSSFIKRTNHEQQSQTPPPKKQKQPESIATRSITPPYKTPPSTVSRATATPSAISRATATPSTISRASATPSAISRATATSSAISRATATPSAISRATATPSTISRASATPSAISRATATPSTISRASATSSAISRASATSSAISRASATSSAISRASATSSAISRATATSSAISRATATPSTSGNNESSSETFHPRPVEVVLGSHTSAQMGTEQLKDNETDTSGKHSKNKPKKKKKKKRSDIEVVTSNPTSTSCIPDYICQFPPLSCDEERQRYKQIFNQEYEDYLQLKYNIDLVTNRYQRDCSALSEWLNSVIKHSDEYMEVKKLIQDKYRDFQRNRSYFDNKNKFSELHQKLDHIKQTVLEYDSRQRENYMI